VLGVPYTVAILRARPQDRQMKQEAGHEVVLTPEQCPQLAPWVPTFSKTLIRDRQSIADQVEDTAGQAGSLGLTPRHDPKDC
jgi:hypothetical protein